MSALWTGLLITVCLLHGLEADEKSEAAPTRCKKPIIQNVGSLSEDKEYYEKYEDITVQCEPGYTPSSDTMMCFDPGAPREWLPSTVTCTAQCQRPAIENMESISEDNEYYDRYSVVTVSCKSGFGPDSVTMTCMKPRSSQEWTPTATCTAQCKKPTIKNVRILLPHEEYYNKREVLSLLCKPGYQPSSGTMRCDNPGTPQEWNPPTVTCKARCKRPEITHMLNPSPYKISYDEGEEVTVYCIDGYYPSHERTRCDQPLTPQEWTPAITCTDITVSERVASTSASFWMSCSSECPHHWRFDVECCDVLYGLCQTMNTDGHVTFSGLQPSSEYQVSITLHNNQKQYKLKPRLIRTKHSVYRYFDVRFPTKQDWTGPANITSFQIIISARRIYDQSFVRDETFWAPHNGTEYKVLLQHGANHTITLQGITVVGFETIKEWNIETDIGDPPHHPPNTLGTNSTLKLYPVSPLNGPISSYDIIVYVDQVKNMSVDCPGFTNTPYNSSLAQSSYTAAVLPAETLTGSRTFILGDNQYYNGFHNAPLTPNHNYNVYIRVSSSWKEVQKSSCSLAGVI